MDCKKYIIALGVIVWLGFSAIAQETLEAITSKVKFDAGKNIEAESTTSKFVLRASDNSLVSLITIKDFIFPNSLMQEHFNENYMESDKFPEASFSGKLKNFKLEGVSETPKEFEAEGKLTIHGEERQVSFPVFISKKGEKYQLTSSFDVKLKDHKIKIPKLMFVKIAEGAMVKIEAVLE